MKTVLIIDDEADLCVLLKKSLVPDGFLVETANSLAEAGVKLKGRFDIIFLDYNLPDGTGLEYLIQNRYLFGRSCIVMISANSSMEIRRQAQTEGIAAFIQKPFTVEFLKKRIKELA